MKNTAVRAIGVGLYEGAATMTMRRGILLWCALAAAWAVMPAAPGLAADVLGSTVVYDASGSDDAEYVLSDPETEITVTGSNTYTLDGIISGTGNLVKTGSGTLALEGYNFFTGGTIVNQGILRIAGERGINQDSLLNAVSGRVADRVDFRLDYAFETRSGFKGHNLNASLGLSF